MLAFIQVYSIDILTVKVQDVDGKDHFYIVEQKTKKAKQRRKKYTVRKAGKNRLITPVRAYEILREAAHHCEIKEIGTHTLRKTFGYLVYQNDKDVAFCRIFLIIALRISHSNILG
ncbi:hypothetical protein LZ480_09475 [Solibacillus sp. MA9]|uniref:Tyr recombinase domain-containing protein n=1 Tax=Solibacillus palustris TaxID=2908203 RepID=A0ABS9UDA5_9BACL|nr:hypothetical protein [Solibacillus sp. MA9]MCH7322119.1 hypothetical protein [Solibacillus sp. MA9]